MNTVEQLAHHHDQVSKETNGLWIADVDTDFRDFGGMTPPKKLMFSLNGKCNLRCDHCPRATADVRSQQTEAAVIDYVIDHVLPTVRSVRLGGTDLGEQLTSRHFNRFLQAIEDVGGIHLEITSNLTLMDPVRADLIARTCSEFGISMEGIGTGYERVRHFPWETVKRNLAMLVEARSKLSESKLKIFPLVTCFHDNLDDLIPILDLADLGVDYFRFRLFTPNTPEQEGQVLAHHAEAGNEVFSQLKRIAEDRRLTVMLPSELKQDTASDVQLIRLEETSLAYKRRVKRDNKSSTNGSGSENKEHRKEPVAGDERSQRTAVPEEQEWRLSRRLRHRLLPVNSRRRVITKTLYLVIKAPRTALHNLNRQNLARFLALFGGAEPLHIEQQVDWRMGHAQPAALHGQASRMPAGKEVFAENVSTMLPEREAGAISEKREPRWICPFPFETVSILSDGEVGTCCSPIAFGYVDTKAPNLAGLWRGDEWRKLRRDVANGIYEGHCESCAYRIETMNRLD